MLRALTGLALATALAAPSAAGPVESTLGLPRGLRVLVPLTLFAQAHRE